MPPSCLNLKSIDSEIRFQVSALRLLSFLCRWHGFTSPTYLRLNSWECWPIKICSEEALISIHLACLLRFLLRMPNFRCRSYWVFRSYNKQKTALETSDWTCYLFQGHESSSQTDSLLWGGTNMVLLLKQWLIIRYSFTYPLYDNSSDLQDGGWCRIAVANHISDKNGVWKTSKPALSFLLGSS